MNLDAKLQRPVSIMDQAQQADELQQRDQDN